MKLGIVCAYSSQLRMQRAMNQLNGEHSLTWMVYQTFQQLEELVQTHISNVDGILCSGMLPYRFLQQAGQLNTLPAVYCELTHEDLYRCIAQIAMQHPGIDFSTVSFDAGRTFGSIEDIFLPNQFPQDQWDHRQNTLKDSLSETYRIILDDYARQWSQGQFQLLVTNFTNVSEKLTQLGIAHIAISPSSNAILEAAGRLIRAVEQHELEQKLITHVILQPRSAKDIDLAALQQTLERYNVMKSLTYVIQRQGNTFELTSSREVLREVTENYTRAKLWEYLIQNGYDSLACGIGTGSDMVGARFAAMRALSESQHHPTACPVIVNQENKLFTISSDQSNIQPYIIDTKIRSMAAKAEMSPFNLQKILSVVEAQGSDQLSSEVLASYMKIKQRSAARILGKLKDAGAAHLVENHQLNQRGRPAKIYKIDLAALERS